MGVLALEEEVEEVPVNDGDCDKVAADGCGNSEEL